MHVFYHIVVEFVVVVVVVAVAVVEVLVLRGVKVAKKC
jgi:hypothetical protein